MFLLTLRWRVRVCICQRWSCLSRVLPGWWWRKLQTVQRADFGGTILALQDFWPGHQGVENLDVVRAIAKLLDHVTLFTSLPLVKDGDLLNIVQHVILARGPRDCPDH